MFVQKSLSLKNYFERKNWQTTFYCLCVNLSTVKIWGQSEKFPMSFSSLQFPLQVKKYICENSAKYVNQRVIFTSGQNLKPPFPCENLIIFSYFFYFIWITTLTEKLKFEENCRSEGIRYIVITFNL